MPLLNIRTNQPIQPGAQPDILRVASALVAELLEKPESYVMVTLQPETPISFAGNQNPAAFLELHSLGLAENKTRSLSAALCQFTTTQLGIPPDRIYIRFENPQRHMWGWNGSTFG
ncbi:MAG: phenylpyruvate tautomerase MIF-related protein [Verrucomicrobiota bacterium JB025]|nr:phenylpyruvate tautomerase MIF-related protein [Verrucomicrobiota bacterium JB025]